MGNCDCANRSRQKREEIECNIRETARQYKIPQPVIYDEQNFLLVDYTRQTFGMHSISQIRSMIPNYKPLDVRCLREVINPLCNIKELSKRDHSYLQVAGRYDKTKDQEVTLTVDFTPSGFRLELGDEKVLSIMQGKKNPRVEYLHIAEQNASSTGGFHEIIDWVISQKDTEYYVLDITASNEINMGKALFDFVVGLFNK